MWYQSIATDYTLVSQTYSASGGPAQDPFWRGPHMTCTVSRAGHHPLLATTPILILGWLWVDYLLLSWWSHHWCRVGVRVSADPTDGWQIRWRIPEGPTITFWMTFIRMGGCPFWMGFSSTLSHPLHVSLIRVDSTIVGPVYVWIHVINNSLISTACPWVSRL